MDREAWHDALGKSQTQLSDGTEHYTGNLSAIYIYMCVCVCVCIYMYMYMKSESEVTQSCLTVCDYGL